MKSEQTKAGAEAVLRGIRTQLENAQLDLRSMEATIERTNETIRTSREALAHTNALIHKMKGLRSIAETDGQGGNFSTSVRHR